MTLRLFVAVLLAVGFPRMAAADDFFGPLRAFSESSGLKGLARQWGRRPAAFREPVESDFLRQLNAAQRAVYAMAAPAVVSVLAPGGQGSGFIADPSGLVVTNAHVVGDARRRIRVRLSTGREYPAKLLAVAPGRDLAFLQIRDSFADWPALPLGESSSLAEGDLVFAIGNPMGMGIAFNPGTVVRPMQDNVNAWASHVLTDVPLSHGNSGGPLLDSSGRVVGVNSAITGTGNKLALSIRTAILKEALEEYRSTGGLVDGFTTLELSSLVSPYEGVLAVVVRAPAGSASFEAGVREGDVIVAVDGSGLPRDGGAARGVYGRFAHAKPGEFVALQVRRGRQAVLRVETQAGVLAVPAISIDSGRAVFVGKEGEAAVAAMAEGRGDGTVEAAGESPRKVLVQISGKSSDGTSFSLLRMPGSAGNVIDMVLDLHAPVEKVGD